MEFDIFLKFGQIITNDYFGAHNVLCSAHNVLCIAVHIYRSARLTRRRLQLNKIFDSTYNVISVS